VIVSILVLRLKAAESFLEISQCTQRTQKRRSAEKAGLRDVKRANFIRYWRRSGLKNLDKLKIFIKKNVRNHSYHQFYPVLRRSGLTEFGLTEVYCISHLYWILERKEYLGKMNNLPKHHCAGPQRCGAQCSCIGCIGLRLALETPICVRRTTSHQFIWQPGPD